MNGITPAIRAEHTPQVRVFACGLIKSAVDDIEAFLNRRRSPHGTSGPYGPRDVLANALGGLLWLRGDVPGLVSCGWICDACDLNQATILDRLDRRFREDLDQRSQWSRLKRLAAKYLAFAGRQPLLIDRRLEPAGPILAKRFRVSNEAIYGSLRRGNLTGLQTIKVGITTFTTREAVDAWIANGGTIRKTKAGA